jgi:hypothetical protein
MAGGEGDGAGGVGRRRPGPDGRHDDLDPRELDRLDITIPDDASELDLDRELWLTEASTTGGDAEPGPVTRPAIDSWADRRGRQRRRLAITAGVVLVSMFVVALSGAIGAWIVGPQAAQAPSTLATDTVDDGQVGGLLPADATLANGEAELAAQSIRPAVIVVVPSPCPECEQLLSTLAPQAATFGVPLVAVGATGQSVQLDQLSDAVSSAGKSRLVTLTDTRGVLASTYGQTTPTVVVVGADGVVTDVIKDPVPDLSVEADLVGVAPGT